MRDRLVAALVGMTIAMIAIYGIPRAYVLADLVGEQEEREVRRSVELAATAVDERTFGTGAEVDEELLEAMLGEAESIEYVDGDGVRLHVGPPQHEGDLVQTRQLADGGTITISRADTAVRERISDALFPLVTMGLGLTLFAGLVGYWLARRLSRPFAELAGAADRLSRARFDLDLPHYTMPEAQAIGVALTRASTQLDDLLRQEREFAANASHQLRTPITALRLTLEDLALWPQTPPEVAQELTANISELDRLGNAITELLELSRGRRLGDAVDVDLSVLVADVVERWGPNAQERGRTIVQSGDAQVRARVVPGPVLQILDALIDNACAYGRGRIVVSAEDRGRYAQFTVADEGERTFGDEVFRRGVSRSDGEGHGLGLTIASELASSLGGHLRLADRPTTALVLDVPTTAPSADVASAPPPDRVGP